MRISLKNLWIQLFLDSPIWSGIVKIPVKSNMESFVTKALTVVAKLSILDVCGSPGYSSDLVTNELLHLKDFFKGTITLYTAVWSHLLKKSLKVHSHVWDYFLATERPLKMTKNAFYFTSKALFVLKIFKFLSWLFGHVGKRLDKKDKVSFKFYDATAWLTNNRNTHIAQYFEK